MNTQIFEMLTSLNLISIQRLTRLPVLKYLQCLSQNCNYVDEKGYDIGQMLKFI